MANLLEATHQQWEGNLVPIPREGLPTPDTFTCPQLGLDGSYRSRLPSQAVVQMPPRQPAVRLPVSIDFHTILVCLLPWGLSPIREGTFPELISNWAGGMRQVQILFGDIRITEC